jgi:hypothetical protein
MAETVHKILKFKKSVLQVLVASVVFICTLSSFGLVAGKYYRKLYADVIVTLLLDCSQPIPTRYYHLYIYTSLNCRVSSLI